MTRTVQKSLILLLVHVYARKFQDKKVTNQQEGQE